MTFEIRLEFPFKALLRVKCYEHCKRTYLAALVYLVKSSLTQYERYGYVTNTKIKFVVVVESANTSLRDNEIRTVSPEIVARSTSWYNVDLLECNSNSDIRTLQSSILTKFQIQTAGM